MLYTVHQTMNHRQLTSYVTEETNSDPIVTTPYVENCQIYDMDNMRVIVLLTNDFYSRNKPTEQELLR